MNQLCFPEGLQWRKDAPVYVIVTARNQTKWVHHLIESIGGEYFSVNFSSTYHHHRHHHQLLLFPLFPLLPLLSLLVLILVRLVLAGLFF